MANFLTSAKLPMSVDCLEFSPFDSNPNMLACGLYQLQTQDGEVNSSSGQNRIGGVQLLRVFYNNDFASFQDFALFRIDTAGILALRWLSDKKLICACSDSQLRFLNVDHNEKTANCENSIPIHNGPPGLLLCIETDPIGSKYLVGDSTGHISIGSLIDIPKIDTWSAHGESEVWCVDFHRGDENLLFSGADDCLLKVWDQRTAMAILSLRHDAGVVSICSTTNSEKLWTGSYDDHLRLWDLRNSRVPVNSLNLGGGVWRIRRRGKYLLCACMYNGWCIVDCEIGEMRDHGAQANCGEMSVVCADNCHGAALSYGIDWVPEKNNIVCSTFYDGVVRMYGLDEIRL